ncbi:hypothetical protein N7517_010551 [Penicillium concentricum]|uniref:F-box domain-containing protein n=1 Tax=Penicillium concentricum TaxID=293559 RepID=A0A9W9R966_9EURO|nr:uncharacterized protein N7517_010551 [Penicillium concentricum]KAJ5355942.1 hypothetical protein N7517_010551 [Penicillium concentricum]
MAGSLPLETLQQIFSYQPDSVIQYACVCRQWQAAAETFTFAELHINSEDLESFRHIVASSRCPGRYFHVRSLYFKVVLPVYSHRARGRYENEDDRHANNKVFTQAITSLFDILSSWPDYDRYQIVLQIYARSPSDWQAEPDWTTRRGRQQLGYAFPEQDLLHRRYERSYLQLTKKVPLPDVKCITTFEVRGSDTLRNIAPDAVSGMVSHFPRLETIIASLRDNEPKDAEISDSLGIDFSLTGWPRSLRQLDLRYEAMPPLADNFSAPFSPIPDFRCRALHQLTQQLESVDLLQIMIGPELFWPSDASHTAPFWPILTKFTASCRYLPPYGFIPFGESRKLDESSSPVPSDVSLEQSDEQRQNLYPRMLRKYLDELFLAAGRAAQCMPRLSYMEIDIGTLRVPAFEFCFRYDATLGTATWTTFSEFCLLKEVHEAWDVAAKSHGHAQISADVLSAESSLSDESSLSP